MDASPGHTVLAMPRTDRLVIHVGMPVLAVLVGLGLPVFARWLLDVSPGLPVRPVFRFVGGVDRPWEMAVNVVVWLLVGLGGAQTAASGSTTVTDTVGVPGAAVARAFQEHGYPWQDADPYADRFGRWAPDSPELPPAVNAVLAARETALRKKAHGEVRSLAEAVEQLGFVVREEGTRQFWRPLTRP